MTASKQLSVRWIRSSIGYSRGQKETIRSLGFTRMQQIRTLPDNEAVRGMIGRVIHLVEVVSPKEKSEKK